MSVADPYVYNGTQVLQNRAGIQDPQVLQEYERRVTSIRADQLAQQLASRSEPVAFDVRHLQATHKQIFQDVYSWAGELRTIEISRGQAQFAPLKTPAGHTLESWGKVIFDELKADRYLQGLDREQFVGKITHLASELNYWHPFRSGNGLTIRAVVAQVAERASYLVDYTKVESIEWNRVSALPASESTHAWRDMFDRATTSLRAIVFERDTREHALKQHSELAGAYQLFDRAKVNAERFPDADARGQYLADRKKEIAQILHTGRVIAVAGQEQAKEGKRPDEPLKDGGHGR